MSTLAGLLSLLALAWCVGFAWFAWDATRAARPVPRADGIVVLTGGAGRIEAALRLLEQDRAQRMLISGVSRGLALPDLLRASRLPPLPPALATRIALGHAATSTIGNARETAAWAHANGLRSLIVVTAGYHMRRAMAEIGTALPEARLRPVPVQPPATARPDLSTVRLLASEYSKFLAVELGLTRSAHLGEIA